jgi:hypothetical protein
MQSKAIGTSCFTQLNDYLRSEVTEDDDLLVFWRSRQATALGLAQMAKDVLAVPIAGVGVERIFSAARRICGYQRHRLSATTIWKLMIVQGWVVAREGEEKDNDKDVMLELSDDVHVPTFGNPNYDMAEAQQISDDKADAGKKSEDAD